MQITRGDCQCHSSPERTAEYNARHGCAFNGPHVPLANLCVMFALQQRVTGAKVLPNLHESFSADPVSEEVILNDAVNGDSKRVNYCSGLVLSEQLIWRDDLPPVEMGV